MIQDALKDLLSGTIQTMLETEMNEHLGYEKYARDDEPNYRNGTKPKTVRSKYGEFEVDVPQDRNSTFQPAVVKKISDITDKLMPQIEDWQNRPLSAAYPIVFIDAIHFSVRNDGIISKLAAYVVLGINEDGMKEVLSIEVGENESSKYWLGILNSLKNRGVQDILILCSDGLTGLKEAIQAAFPNTEHQRCIVHMVRNTLKYVANKDMKAFARDLKTIYTAADEKAALKRLDEVTIVQI